MSQSRVDEILASVAYARTVCPEPQYPSDECMRILADEVVRLRERLELPRSVDHTAAVQAERAAVVASLREAADRRVISPPERGLLLGAAQHIERGEHIK